MGFTEDKCDDVRKEALKRHNLDVEAELDEATGTVTITLYGERGNFYPSAHKWSMTQPTFNGTLMDQLMTQIMSEQETKKRGG